MNPPQRTVKLIVHGGAWSIPDAQVTDHVNGVKSAVQKTFPLLQQGMSAIEAVEAAVNILEADPTFDAGRGAFLNELGEIELDAMIMDGRNLDFGAVAAVQNILHPVSLARKVMEQTEHHFVVGKGAQNFATKMGIKELAPQDLLTERELALYHELKDNPNFKTHHPFQNEPRDTVGAVALDQYGNLAAATSTGGTPRKMQGRVGDSPIVGAGAYADNWTGAVSTTGWGESIMKVLLAKTVCDLFNTKEAIAAAKMGLDILEQRAKGLGGLIGINKNGDYTFAHNTARMAFAYTSNNGEVIANIRV